MRHLTAAFTPTLMLVCLLIFAFDIQPVQENGTIYIRADGSIDPPTAPISTLDNVTYTLTNNITSSGDGIIVERDSITIDGNGYTLQGYGSGNGFYLSCDLLHVAIENTDIKGFSTGIWAEQFVSATISRNNITTCAYGIDAEALSNCVVCENTITTCGYGIVCGHASFCEVFGNNINKGLHCGIVTDPYSRVSIRGNIITDNALGMSLSAIDSIISGNNITGSNGHGIAFSDSNACNVTGNLIANNTGDGIVLSWSVGDITMSENTITTNGGNGICVCTISGTAKIVGNTILNNYGTGIKIDGGEATASEITSNTMAGNEYGVWIGSPAEICHNNFLNNTNQAFIANSTSVWDDGYPSGGNYWIDHNGTDLFRGSHQNETGSDGISDTPHVINADSRDRFPLMHPWSPLPIHNMNTGLGYLMIQEAVNAPETQDEHVIFAETGTYHENVAIHKSIALIGEDRTITIVDGNHTGSVITVMANNVRITNLTIQDSGEQGCGINVTSNDNMVSNNIITANFWGIMLNGSQDNVISYNGIFRNGWSGIGLYSTSNNTILGNSISSNHYSGLNLINSSNNLITGNEASSHVSMGLGFYIAYSEANILQKNTAISNNGIGFYLYFSNKNTLADNVASTNSIGVSLNRSHSSTITGNTVLLNSDWGIQMTHSENLQIFHNHFENTQQVNIKNSTAIWSDPYPSCGNYWSDYNGTDSRSGPHQNETGGDGIGDMPYIIDENHQDSFPLIEPWSPVNSIKINVSRKGEPYPVLVTSNATTLTFAETPGSIKLRVTGETGSTGYVRIVQPVGLNSTNIAVFDNDTRITFPSTTPPRSISTNGTHYFIYLTVTFTSTYELLVTFPIGGDVDYNGEVNIFDIVRMASAYDTIEGHPKYNAHCDIDADGDVDVFDLVIAASHYGEYW